VTWTGQVVTSLRVSTSAKMKSFQAHTKVNPAVANRLAPPGAASPPARWRLVACPGAKPTWALRMMRGYVEDIPIELAGRESLRAASISRPD
jgi:hypothetical protein